MARGRKIPKNIEAGSTAPESSERPVSGRMRQPETNSYQADRPAEPGLGLNLDEEMLGDIWDELLDELTTLGVGEGAASAPDGPGAVLEDAPEGEPQALPTPVEEAAEALPADVSVSVEGPKPLAEASEIETEPQEAAEAETGSPHGIPASVAPALDSPGEMVDASEGAQDDAETTPAPKGGEPHSESVAEPESESVAEPESESESAAPVSEVIEDELVLGLVQKEVVTRSQVLAAVRTQPEGMPLWRMLVAQKGVDMDAIFAEVASAQGVRHAETDPGKPSPKLLEALVSRVSREEINEMFRLGLLPYEARMTGSSEQPSFIFVTHDPTREAILDFVQGLKIETELRYAPSRFVADRISSLKHGGFGESGSRYEEASTETVSPYVQNPPTDTFSVSEDLESLLGGAGDARNLSFPDLPDQWSEEVSGDEQVPDASADPEASMPLEVSSGEGIAAEPVSDASAGVDPGEAGEEEDRGAQQGSKEEPCVLSRDAKAAKSKDRVVTALMWKREVTPKQVALAVERQKEGGGKELLWRLLAQVKGVNAERVYEEAARVYAFPTAELGEGRPDKEFVMLIMETVAESNREDLLDLLLLPFEYDIDPQTGAARLIFITHDPARPEVHRILQDLNLGRFELQYAPESAIRALVEEIFPRKNEYLERMSDDPMAFDLGTSYDQKDNELIDEDALEAEISRSSLINLFEATLVEAVRQGVSDIHIFPNPKRQIEIHFRVDGKLKRWFTEEKVHPESFLAVVKDNSVNVDRFERDSAQDGFIQRWVDGALIRFRVSVLPIASAAQELRAESIVIRVLDDRKVLTDLRKLGMLDVALERFERAIRQPYGMVILTGPTGSGKSTTLVAALHQVVTPDVNVLTVEDPVEYIIKGVRQIKLNQKLDLEGALRAILRHDPDVVMVGEMRDRATAELAIKLANTGHLTFSTLHTNDAPSAVSRLYKMGVEPFLIAYAINLVVAQRLIRNLCPECKKVDEDPDVVMLAELGFSEEEIEQTVFYTEGGDAACPVCSGVGYKGRRAICETLYFTREIRHMIVEAGEKIDEEALRDQAVEDGMLTLQDSARELVKMGATSVQEMMRVTASEG